MYFDFEGSNRKTNSNTNFDEVHYTRWINSKRDGTTYAKNTCTNYPTDFITNPKDLFSYTLTGTGIEVTA